jgi:D-serine deaminase-like pyridoxal phosphate-dependent protein
VKEIKLIPGEDIETPALLIDLDALERNILTMSAFAKDNNISLRPHFKTVKIPEIALMQVKAGAKGITCAKLSEAEVLADAGVESILLACQIVAPAKLDRLAQLAGHIKYTAVAVDSVECVHYLNDACAKRSTKLHVLVELDVGQGRCGVRSYEEGLEVSRAIMESPNLKLDGIHAYEGHLVLKPELQTRIEGVEKLLAYVGGFRDFLEQHSIPVNEISGGGSGTFNLTCKSNVYTELQVGSYIYMDARYNKLELPFEQALYVMCMVISSHKRVAVLDGGLKSISTDNGEPLLTGLKAESIKLSEEYCIVRVPDKDLNLRDTVIFIPSHCCTTINLYDKAYGIRGGRVERVFDVKGRGKST